MKIKMVTVISCIFLSSCSAEFAPTRSSFSPSVIMQPEAVEVYRSEKPSKPYQEIGTVYFPSESLALAIDKMKIEAAKNGGNAIIDIKISSDGISGTVVQFK